MSKRFGRIKIQGDQVKQGRQGGPLAGARATVDAGGGIDRRVSGTRVFLMFGAGLLWKKKVDNRELYLIVDGPGYHLVEKAPPKRGHQARKFAATLNTLADKAAAAQAARPQGFAPYNAQPGQLGTSLPVAPSVAAWSPPPVPAWAQDPTGRHGTRYWDGARWTEHVSDGGVATVDPMP